MLFIILINSYNTNQLHVKDQRNKKCLFIIFSSSFFHLLVNSIYALAFRLISPHPSMRVSLGLIIAQVFFKERITRSMFPPRTKLFICIAFITHTVCPLLLFPLIFFLSSFFLLNSLILMHFDSFIGFMYLYTYSYIYRISQHKLPFTVIRLFIFFFTSPKKNKINKYINKT